MHLLAFIFPILIFFFFFDYARVFILNIGLHLPLSTNRRDWDMMWVNNLKLKATL